MEDHGVIDIYTINDKTYMDLNPAIWIEISDHEIQNKFSQNIPSSLEIHRVLTYNVAIFLKFDKMETINFNKKDWKIKVIEFETIHLSQLCLVFKNEWSRIPKFINFYKRVHGIERFLLYDNNSSEKIPDELLLREDVIYIPWNIPYKTIIKNKKTLGEDYTGPDEIITGQNSAYSHALKKFSNSTWTLFLDTDEFVVRRSGNPSLKTILETTPSSTDTLILRGFWAGCNKFQKHEIYENLRKISRRSNRFCMNKLILRTNRHVFTDCIHRAYPTTGTATMLGFDKGIYFFHLYIVSEKRSQCICNTYCNHHDRSLMDSFLY
jgi:hypothetical protein